MRPVTTRRQRDLRAKFGARVRQERQALGWSQARLAEELSTAPSTVAYWEQGGGATEEYVDALEALFGLEPGTLGWMLGYKDPPSRLRTEDAIERDDNIPEGYKRVLRAALAEIRNQTTAQQENGKGPGRG